MLQTTGKEFITTIREIKSSTDVEIKITFILRQLIGRKNLYPKLCLKKIQTFYIVFVSREKTYKRPLEKFRIPFLISISDTISEIERTRETKKDSWREIWQLQSAYVIWSTPVPHRLIFDLSGACSKRINRLQYYSAGTLCQKESYNVSKDCLRWQPLVLLLTIWWSRRFTNAHLFFIQVNDVDYRQPWNLQPYRMTGSGSGLWKLAICMEDEEILTKRSKGT